MAVTARFERAIVWVRRDLRLHDHAALHQACVESGAVAVAFVLDPGLLRGPRVGSPIVSFFFDALGELRDALRERGSDLVLLEGDFAAELLRLARGIDASALYFNDDYEPSARRRDDRVEEAFRADGRAVTRRLDHVYRGAREVLKDDGEPYVVFSPYKRRWLALHEVSPVFPYPSEASIRGKLIPAAGLGATREIPALHVYGHAPSPEFPRGGERRGRARLDKFFAAGGALAYRDRRDFPAVGGTSHLSPDLRAGTVAIRTCFARAFAEKAEHPGMLTGVDTWISELIWREFYQQILANFPHVENEPFLAAARGLKFRECAADFAAWCEGRTGYPIVDAAMAQLNRFGWMHNRLRMIVASFLTKDLLLDYRLGERYFEQHLADGDLAANNGGWQWAASTGTDAAPYFRVFNPVLQSKKFDPDGRFIRAMLPHFADVPAGSIHDPVAPIVDHSVARGRAIAAYARVLGRAGPIAPQPAYVKP